MGSLWVEVIGGAVVVDVEVVLGWNSSLMSAWQWETFLLVRLDSGRASPWHWCDCGPQWAAHHWRSPDLSPALPDRSSGWDLWAPPWREPRPRGGGGGCDLRGAPHHCKECLQSENNNYLEEKYLLLIFLSNIELYFLSERRLWYLKTKHKGPMHQYYSQSFRDQISFVFFAIMQIQSNNDEMVRDH